MEFNLGDHLVDAAAPFLTDAEAPQQRGQRLVPRGGWAVEESIGRHQRLAGVGDFNAVVEDLHHRPGTCDEEVLVDEGIGHQFPHGQLREHRHGGSQRLPDDFVGRQQAVNEPDQPLEATGIAFAALQLLQGLGAVTAAVVDHAHRLAAQGAEGIKALGEQDGAEIGDVPAASMAFADEAIGGQGGEDPLPIVGQRQFQQFEVGRVIQQLQHLISGGTIDGEVLLERGLIEDAPEGPFLLGSSLEFLLVAARAISSTTTDLQSMGTLKKRKSILGSRSLSNQLSSSSLPTLVANGSKLVPTMAWPLSRTPHTR